MLFLIAQEELYGYELMRRLSSIFPDMQESALYASLRKLCTDGYLLSCRSQSVDGPPRKYYQLTPLGIEKRDTQLQQWRSFSAAIKALGIE